MRLMYPGGFEVFEDHLGEILDRLVAADRFGLALSLRGFERVDQLVIPVDREGAMRRLGSQL